jgi:gamma-glutamyltranspeptidase/glutathione hydrolase
MGHLVGRLACAALGASALAFAGSAPAADLSPGHWPADLRAELEQREFYGAPAFPATVQGKSALITATASPVAVHAGMEALRRGGTAADAAATVALTQITTDLGAVVSFAGVSELLYFEGRTGKVYALEGHWTRYAGENDPASIPGTDISLLNGQPPPPGAGVGPLGRQTLVPGFMAALEAMHTRFGRLPFAEVFQPALWYADNGVTISPARASWFARRKAQFWRTSEGRRFASMPDGALPKTGDLYRQPDLARTLRAVAAQGSAYMYTGDWARAFVTQVQADGGKVTAEDLARYKPVWSQPPAVRFAGATVFGPNEDPSGTCPTLEALNLLGGLHVEAMGPYWRDPKAFKAYARALAFAQFGHLAPPVAEAERAAGFTSDCASRLTPRYAATFAPELGPPKTAPPSAPPPPPPTPHTDAIIVVDRWGNVAALVHTSNVLVWGDTGIVVGGVPIPDAAPLNAWSLSTAKPGQHLANPMTPVIALKDGKPVLAVASTGASLVPEATRLVGGALVGNPDLKALMRAPPLLMDLNPPAYGKSLWDWPQSVPPGAYDAGMIRALAADGVTVHEETTARARDARGSAVVAVIDQASGTALAVEVPEVNGFAESNGSTRQDVPRELALSSEVLDRYVGDYQLAPGIVATITRRGDHLFAERPGWPRAELFADAADHFFEKLGDIQVTFHVGPNGRAGELVVRQSGYDRTGVRIGLLGGPGPQ